MKAPRLGSEEVSYSDRISHLPDDLLFQILSFIPVSDAMATSLLSKRWKSRWKMLPTLEYDENSCPNIGSFRFHKFCRRSLKLRESPVLKTLNLKLRNPSDSLDLLFPFVPSTLFETIITSNSTSYPCYISFRYDLSVFKTLVVLKLQGHILLDVVDSPVCFRSLKSLYLKSVKFRLFRCEESFSALLSACPVLEDLFFQRHCKNGSFLFTISVPSLQRFITKEPVSYSYSDDPRFEINTPSLKYLKIFDRVGSYNFIADMPKLAEANVEVNLSKNGKLLEVLTSVEHLSLELYPSMVFHLTDRLIFNRLIHLELDIYNNFLSNLLLRFLKDFPNLRALKLNHIHPSYDIEDQPCLVTEPSSVPKCLSFHLETLHWIGNAGTHEEREAAVYVLENACHLKNATFSLHSTGTENDLMMIEELNSMSKASMLCQLLIKF